MKITIWGGRGSLPTPGIETSRYGGNTTCISIQAASGDITVVDAGSGVRNLGKYLRKKTAIHNIRFFFTHSHWDHLMGFPFFQPAYHSDYSMTFCGGIHAQDSIRSFLSHQMEAPYFPVDFSQLKATSIFHCDNPHHEKRSCNCHGLQVMAIHLNHPNGAYGYKFVEDGKSFIFIPDNELGFDHGNGAGREQMLEYVKNADLLIHDSQYSEAEYRYTRGWGHSTYADAIDFAMAANVKSVGLFHHDPDRTDDDLDRQVTHCRQRIQATASNLNCFAVAEGMEIEL